MIWEEWRTKKKNSNIYFLRYGRLTGYFLTKDMQTTSLSFDPVFMDDAQCAKTNEKSIFRFLFFELSWKFNENWGGLSTKMTKTRKMQTASKECSCSEIMILSRILHRTADNAEKVWWHAMKIYMIHTEETFGREGGKIGAHAHRRI